jgi:hypothetical protein
LIHQTMLEGDKETEESEEEEEEEQEEDDEAQEELRKRNSIIRRQNEEIASRERQSRESDQNTKAEIERLKKQLELEKQKEAYNREQLEKEMSEKMERALAIKQRASPRVSVHERPFTWDYALELLAQHSSEYKRLRGLLNSCLLFFLLFFPMKLSRCYTWCSMGKVSL